MRRRACRHRPRSSPSSRRRLRLRLRPRSGPQPQPQPRTRPRPQLLSWPGLLSWPRLRPRPRSRSGCLSRCRSGCRRCRVFLRSPASPASPTFLMSRLFPRRRRRWGRPLPRVRRGLSWTRPRPRPRPRPRHRRRRRRVGRGPWLGGRPAFERARRRRLWQRRPWRRRTRRPTGRWVPWSAARCVPFTGSRPPAAGPRPSRRPRPLRRTRDRPAAIRPAGRRPTAVSHGTVTRMPSSRPAIGRRCSPRSAVGPIPTSWSRRTGTGTSRSSPVSRSGALRAAPRCPARPPARSRPPLALASGLLAFVVSYPSSRPVSVAPFPSSRFPASHIRRRRFDPSTP